jgi:hypothetical protein
LRPVDGLLTKQIKENFDAAASDIELLQAIPSWTSPSPSEPGLEDLGEGVAFEIDAGGVYSCTAIGDTEITVTPPAEGSYRATVHVRTCTVVEQCLAATYRAEDEEEEIAAEVASFSGQLTADTLLRVAKFLIGGTGIYATFTATLSDSSASDDPIFYAFETGINPTLITVSYRAGAAGQTLDWSLVQTNDEGTLLLAAIAAEEVGTTGAASLTISDTAQAERLDLDIEGLGGWLYVGRDASDFIDVGPAGFTGPSTLETGGELTVGTGPEVSWTGVSPATDYVVTIAGVSGWSAKPEDGLLQLRISAFDDSEIAVEPLVIRAPTAGVIFPSADVTKADADAIYSAQGHGHSDISDSVTAVNQAIQTHEATKVHVDRARIVVRVPPEGGALADEQVIPFVWDISGYVTAIKAFCMTAPTTTAAAFAIKAGAWGATPAAVADPVSIAATTFTGSQTTIDASGVVKDQMGTITVAADTGGTAADAIVVIEINPGDVVPGDPEDPEVDGRLVTVTWVFPSEENSTIDRFEMLRNGSPVYTTSTVTDRSATLFFYWDSLYTLRACLEDSCSEVADQIVAVFRPALAASGTATASSYRTTGGVDRVASAAIDGRSSTFWWGNETTGASWLMVDLGESKSITGYRLNMGANRGTAWTAQTSANGTDFTTVDTIAADQGHIYIKDGLSATGRYLRINFSAYSQNTGALVRELEVTGS